MTDPIRASDAQAIIDTVKQLHEPTLMSALAPVPGGNAPLVAVPAGMSLVSVKKFVDEWRDKPERRTGKVPLLDLASFIEYVNRFKDQDTVIFADNDRKAPGLVGIIDYHRQGFTGDPAWCGHRALYSFPLSEEWKTWHAVNGKRMAQGDFAAFLEDHIDDVIAPPLPDDAVAGETAGQTARRALLDRLLVTIGGSVASPSRLMELSRGLAISSEDKVAQAINLQTGEAKINYESRHVNEQGQKIEVPTLFLIAIPVFTNGPLYSIAARLRYRLAGGSIEWFFSLYRTDKVFDDAFNEALVKVHAETAAETLIGKPE